MLRTIRTFRTIVATTHDVVLMVLSVLIVLNTEMTDPNPESMVDLGVTKVR